MTTTTNAIRENYNQFIINHIVFISIIIAEQYQSLSQDCNSLKSYEASRTIQNKATKIVLSHLDEPGISLRPFSKLRTHKLNV